jgi:hypothetical protein
MRRKPFLFSFVAVRERLRSSRSDGSGEYPYRELCRRNPVSDQLPVDCKYRSRLRVA